MNPLNSLTKQARCLVKGHRFVASRSEANVDVCVRCRTRRPHKDGSAGQALASLRQKPPEKD